MARQNLPQNLADISSVIRVLNELKAKIIVCQDIVFFKTRARKFEKDLESFAETYHPLVELNVHHCRNPDCCVEGYHVLKMSIRSDVHQEAASRLYDVIQRYSR